MCLDAILVHDLSDLIEVKVLVLTQTHYFTVLRILVTLETFAGWRTSRMC